MTQAGTYPQSIAIQLNLEIEVSTPDEHEYMLEHGDLTTKFLLDLFDTLKYDTNLTVTRVNGRSFDDLKAEHDRDNKL